MEECVDGEYQNFKAKGGAYTRENFFGKYPELKEMVANMSDDDIWRLNRGGHDYKKVWNAYNAAGEPQGQPTVILAKTVKGFLMGRWGESQNPTHQQKKLDDEALREFRKRIFIDVSDAGNREARVQEARRRQSRNEVSARAARACSAARCRSDAPPRPR